MGAVHPINTSAFQLGVPPDEDVEEETPLLKDLADRAEAYVASLPWAPPIAELLLAAGVGKILGLFLVRFAEPTLNSGDTEKWVVVGDIPSVCFETEDVLTTAVALELYCAICQDWADSVLEGRDISECYPIHEDAAPTVDNATLLNDRVAFIRKELIPLADQPDRRTKCTS